MTALERVPDIEIVPRDLETPPMTEGDPAPGRRVRQTAPEYRGMEVYHALYLPRDWRPGRRFPVLVEYAGNGGYHNPEFGDFSSGRVEGSNLGYGLSAGEGFIWLCMPYVNAAHTANELSWWGDADATAAYCLSIVRRVCGDYGGDPESVVLCGFSRGAIACNYIGLRNDEIAGLWRAFVAHSHYDGVIRWGYEGADPASALVRLRRLNGRPQWISQEISVEDTRRYLEGTGVQGEFTLVAIPYRNHRDDWVLRDIPERRLARRWLRAVLPHPAGRDKA